MLVLMKCVAEAVMARGIRGLTELVPGGAFLYDVSLEALRRLRERKRADQLRAEIVELAAASFDEARQAAEEVARQVAASTATPIEDRISLELYLTQMPACVRQSMKRADDPSGKTVPADFALEQPSDLARLLPQRLPQFRTGDGLPGRSGWTLHELLGAGGFGEVWLVRHSFIPNLRAVKFCTDLQARSRLATHEGKVIARVMVEGHHPNVVALLDASLEGETPWLMYEYVGGGSLIDLIHSWQSLPPDRRQSFTIAALHQLSLAVATFHRLAPPIVHRDLKPSNILLAGPRTPSRDDSGVEEDVLRRLPVLRITDFGIGGVALERTALLNGFSQESARLETALRGSYTPLYASPQQRAGSPPDPRDDVHALGVIGYQMTTGRLDQAPGIDAADDLRDSGAGEGFIQLLTRCVAQKAERRPRDSGELAERFFELQQSLRDRAVGPAGSSDRPLDHTPAARQKFLSDRTSDQIQAPAERPAEGPTIRLLPFVGTLYSRPTGSPVSDWKRRDDRLPGNVQVRPGEAYRIALSPGETTDQALAEIGLRSLLGIPGLEAIDLGGCSKVTDAGLALLMRLGELKAANLSHTSVTDSGVALLLGRFDDLEAVAFEGLERLSPAVLPYLFRLRNLKWVVLPPRIDTVDVRVELARRLPGCRIS